MTSSLWLLVAIVSIIASGIFSGMETGLYTINKIRLDLLCGKLYKRAIRVSWYLKNPIVMLTVILLANNTANYIGSRALSGFLKSLEFNSIIIVVIDFFILVPVILLFGEIVPKELFRLNTNKWSYSLIRLLDFIGLIMTFLLLAPIIFSVGKILESVIGSDRSIDSYGKKRILGLLEEGVDAGILSAKQQSLAEKALNMRDQKIKNQITVWNNVKYLPLNANNKKRFKIINNSLFTRMPVLDRKNNVCGIINTLEILLNPGKNTSELMKKPIFINETDSISKILSTMRTKGHMAIVKNKDKEIGIVTIKDLIEPLTGEIKTY